MTLNRRRAALSAVIVAVVIGWAGAGVASASDDVTDSNKWDIVSDSNKWD
ncbi:MAG TPA: hypothetical protein VFR23_00690 [Jiangellaceae bacterium]|nr:hypothetical protein [Jiangellaceae bacterium]